MDVCLLLCIYGYFLSFGLVTFWGGGLLVELVGCWGWANQFVFVGCCFGFRGLGCGARMLGL